MTLALSIAPTDLREWDDDDLVAEVRGDGQQSAEAFELLVERHSAYVVNTCRFQLGSEHEAEDLAQEVFTKAFFALDSFEHRSAFRTWLRRIAVNHCLNHLKKNRRQSFISLEDPALLARAELQHDPSATGELEATDDRERIGWALEAMPETLRSALVLREWKGLSYQEIAEELDLGMSAVKMRIKRARESFQDCWEKSERPSFATLGRLRKIEPGTASAAQPS
ncbi:MAG: RNA polymerase sigma factor [Acidobacteriota bacterium]